MLLKLRAYAKINLSLKVLGKRADGYHEIESLMQSVSLSDYLTLEPVSSGIAIFTNDPSLAVDHRNLAFRAAELFFHRQKNCPIKGIKIYLQKCIPVAAGLAGGSADAAAVIWGLNQMMEEKERLSEEKLLALGAQIGSDVPFCLIGGRCWVKGRGELVSKQQRVDSRQYYILTVPNIEISTKWAYEAWDELVGSKEGAGGEREKYQNDLEIVVGEKFPIIKEVKKRLIALGCEGAQMSGSGPSVFGVVRDQNAAQRILEEMRKEYPRSFLLEAADKGIEIGEN